MKSFMDEDWTGLTHIQIKSMILQELEEQQCKEEGHHFVPAFYCSVCGIQSWEALEAFENTLKKRRKE